MQQNSKIKEARRIACWEISAATGRKQTAPFRFQETVIHLVSWALVRL
jgi:hypothetical protein